MEQTERASDESHPAEETAIYQEDQRLPGPDPPRVYVASLSDYNAGLLHGEWIDATNGSEQMHDEVTEMLERSEEPHAEEYAIHDYEGFGRWAIHEYERLERVAAVGEGIAEHGLAFAALVALDPEVDLDTFQDRYLGHWNSMTRYVEDMLDDQGIDTTQHIPQWLQPYVQIDLEALAIDMGNDLEVEEVEDGGVWVFESSVE